MPFVRHELGQAAADQADPGPPRPSRRHRGARHARPAAARASSRRASIPDDDDARSANRCRRPLPRLHQPDDPADEPPSAVRPPVAGRVRDASTGGRPARSADVAARRVARSTAMSVDLDAVPRRRADRPSSTALRGARRVLAVSHENPDADTLGATLGVVRLVEAHGRHGRRRSAPTRSRRSTTSCRASSAFRTDPDPAAPLRPARDLRLRLARAGRRRRRAPRRAVRAPAAGDHRPPRLERRRPARPTGSTRPRPPPARWSRCSRPPGRRRSTPTTGALAAALMAGIVMDTATFAHPNATPRTLAVSAALVEAGAPLSDISRRLYRTKPDAQLRLFGGRARPARERRRRPDRLVERDRRRLRRDRRRNAPTRRGSSTCSSQAEDGRGRDPVQGGRPTATRISVRTQARRRGRDRPDRPVRRWRACARRRAPRRRAARRGATAGPRRGRRVSPPRVSR